MCAIAEGMPRLRIGKKVSEAEIELRPDGWERFERAVDAAVVSGPRRRPPEKMRAAAREIATLALRLGRATDSKWSTSILIPSSLFEGEIPQRIEVASCACRPTMAGELIRIDFDINQRMTAATEQFRRALSAEMLPLLKSLGDLVLEQTPKGVIVRRNVRPVKRHHRIRSLSGVATAG
jgi:hypothetical protein